MNSTERLTNFFYMSKPLPRSLDLIKDTWKLFTSSWNDTVKLSIWFLYFGLVNFALALVEKYAPGTSIFLSLPLQFVMMIIAVWVGIRLMQVALDLESGKKADMSKEVTGKAWQLWLPIAWVGFLMFLIIIGGTILLIIPGIYLGLALGYSSLFVVDKNVRGFEAIKASYALVKGRWWATWWREVACGFVFAVGLMIIIGFLQMALAVVSLGSTAAFSNIDAASSTPLFQATQNLFSSIVEAAAMPLFVILRVKIYRALQQTQA